MSDALVLPADQPSTETRPVPPRQRYKLTLAYDGSDFHGWQKQEPPGKPPLRTVAGVVESTLAHSLQQPIELVGSSRTDAGVHARGQVAQFDAATRIPVERLAEAINSRLPHDIEIVSAEVAAPDFDAIKQTTSKQYRYRLFTSQRRPLDRRWFVYHCWTPLDLDRMGVAAAKLVGTHNFAGLAAADHNRTTTVRTIFDCRIESEPPESSEVHILVTGSGFLYNMVRIIVGTLVEVGRGRFEPDVIDHILATRDRRQAGPTLPPQGLWLEWIRYEARQKPGGNRQE